MEHIGRPFPYGTKVAARYIARANVQPGPGILTALNHTVGGYMRGLAQSYLVVCGMRLDRDEAIKVNAIMANSKLSAERAYEEISKRGDNHDRQALAVIGACT